MSKKLPLLVLVGPTGVGKTALSVAVAKRVDGEIISGDSVQVYRGMDVGTAKITAAEMDGVPHHLIDVCRPNKPFTVAEFQRMVDHLIHEIVGRDHLPMLVGGTGLYVRSVVMDYTFTEMASDPAFRERLAQEEAKRGPGYLHAQLQAVDPEAADRVHPNDLRRLVRALEVFELSGVPISQTQTATHSEPRYDDLSIGLTMERELLNERIDQRVDQMLSAGLIDEVQSLLRQYPPQLQAMEAIGYREAVLYLRGQLTYGEMAALIKRNTRRFAKRQFTWFRRDGQIRWIDLSTHERRQHAVEETVKLVEGKWPKGVEA